MCDCTPEESRQIMADFDKAMKDYEDELNKIAPRCHFRPMCLDGWSDDQWWVCSVCGHTKNT